VIYPGLVLLMAGLFLASLASTHQLVAEAKRSELIQVRRRLSEAYAAWHQDWSRDTAVATADAVVAWLAWEHRLLETPEWPWQAGLLRALGASLLAPVLALAVRLLFGYIL
jgi:hypothetical protein